MGLALHQPWVGLVGIAQYDLEKNRDYQAIKYFSRRIDFEPSERTAVKLSNCVNPRASKPRPLCSIPPLLSFPNRL